MPRQFIASDKFSRVYRYKHNRAIADTSSSSVRIFRHVETIKSHDTQDGANAKVKFKYSIERYSLNFDTYSISLIFHAAARTRYSSSVHARPLH